MFEIFDCSLAFRQIGKQVGQMNAGPKVVLIDLKALLVVEKAFLIFLEQLISLSQVEKCA